MPGIIKTLQVAEGTVVSAPSAADGTATAKSASYTVTDIDNIRTVLMTTGASDRTVTLPTAADNAGRLLCVKKVDSGVGTVIIDGEGAETIDGVATYTMYGQYESATLNCDGTSWHIIDRIDKETGALSVYARNTSGSGTGAGVEAGPFSCHFTRVGGLVSITVDNGVNLALTTTAVVIRLSTTSGTDAWPARLLPARAVSCVVPVIETGRLAAAGMITMGTTFPAIFKGPDASGFGAGSASKGLPENTGWTYSLA